MQKYGAVNNSDLLMIAMDRGLNISGILTLDSFDHADMLLRDINASTGSIKLPTIMISALSLTQRHFRQPPHSGKAA